MTTDDLLDVLAESSCGPIDRPAAHWESALDAVDHFELRGCLTRGAELGEILNNFFVSPDCDLVACVFDCATYRASKELEDVFGVAQDFDVYPDGCYTGISSSPDDVKRVKGVLADADPDKLRGLSKTCKTVLADWGDVNVDEIADAIEQKQADKQTDAQAEKKGRKI